MMDEVVLTCGCHKASANGLIYSQLKQFSKSGRQGIQTVQASHWSRLTGTQTKKGYWQIAIHGRSIRVNRLIAQLFIPNPDGYPESQHRDGNKDDNRASNLKWGTQTHNAADRDQHGHTAKGEKNATAKLDDTRVRLILSLRRAGLTLQAIADRFSVSKKLVLLIVQRKIWRHVCETQ
jgi:HNH endonuclease